MAIDPASSAGFGVMDALAFAAPVCAAAACALFWRTQRLSALARRRGAEARQLRRDLETAEAAAREAHHVRAELREAETECVELKTKAAEDAVRLEERARALADLKARMETDFEALAAKLLETSHASFLARANETFERQSETAAADLERRRRSLDELIRPMGETLARYEKNLGDMRAEQAAARANLLGRMGELAATAGQVRDEAQKLRSALKAGPRAAGRWGEEQLRNVVEAAGMAAHVDFIEQAALGDNAASAAARRQTPDMIVNLPGGRKMAVDAKVSVGAYLDAADCEDARVRAGHLERHGDDLWTHVKTLAARDYAAAFKDSLDMVIMFVPGENYFAAALDARPGLFQDAFDRKVLIATPMTLVAMLKAASFHWRQEKAAEHAAAVAGQAKGLYDSLKAMGGHLVDLGRTLDRSVQKYNAAMAGFDRRVMTRARRFAEYELPGVDAPLPDLPPIETAVAHLANAALTDESSAAESESADGPIEAAKTDDDQSAA